MHEAKLNTRVTRADEKSDAYAVDDFLDSLRKPPLNSAASRPSITLTTPQKTSAKNNH
nr:MAG TPA: hypothetical protein [Caudoviricetes sp.]